LETDLSHYKGLLENERKSRQTVTEAINKKDVRLEDIERVNFELSNQVELKNGIIRKHEDEIQHYRYQLQDGGKENHDLHQDLVEQNDRIKELETDLAQ
jgi:chromosome segregation ATPase